MKKIIVLKIVFIVLLMLITGLIGVVSGMGSSNVVREPVTPEGGQAESLVSNTFKTYRSFSFPSFSSLFAASYAPDSLAMVNRVDTYNSRVIIISLKYSINTVSDEAGIKAISFNWEKTVQRNIDGGLMNTSGEAVFAYKQDKGGWKITNIEGDNPFL